MPMMTDMTPRPLHPGTTRARPDFPPLRNLDRRQKGLPGSRPSEGADGREEAGRGKMQQVADVGLPAWMTPALPARTAATR